MGSFQISLETLQIFFTSLTDGFIRQSFQMRLSAKLSDALPLFVSNSFSTFQALFSSSCKSRDPYYFLLVESTFPGRLLELETE